MMSGDTSLSGPSTLHDEAFFDPASVEIGLDFMVHRCLTQERSQVLIDAPKHVAPSARALPVLGVWCRTHREDLAIRWTDRASVVAVRLDDGAAAAGAHQPAGRKAGALQEQQRGRLRAIVRRGRLPAKRAQHPGRSVGALDLADGAVAGAAQRPQDNRTRAIPAIEQLG